MRFTFTMNMPVRNGAMVHQVIGDHPSESLEDLLSELEGVGYVVVTECYTERDEVTGRSVLAPHGETALLLSHIGKVKITEERD